jgi:hypothetical protein
MDLATRRLEEVARLIVGYGDRFEACRGDVIVPAALVRFAADMLRPAIERLGDRSSLREEAGLLLAALEYSAVTSKRSASGTHAVDSFGAILADADDVPREVPTDVVAERLRCSRRNVTQLVGRGELRGRKVSARCWLVEVTSIDEYLARRS